MDRAAVSEAANLGSNPGGSAMAWIVRCHIAGVAVGRQKRRPDGGRRDEGNMIGWFRIAFSS